MIGHLTTVAGEHHRLLHTEGLQRCDGLGAVGLDLVVDDDMTGIFTIDGYMDNGTHMMAVVPMGTDDIHHLRVAHTDDVRLVGISQSDGCTDTMTRNLLYVKHLTTICSLVGEGVAQCRADGMGGEVLDVSSEVEELVFEEGGRRKEEGDMFRGRF